MAGIAVGGRMSAKQREPVLVLFDVVGGGHPSPNRMTSVAVACHLPPVDVGVAAGTAFAHVGENKLNVALPARHG